MRRVPLGAPPSLGFTSMQKAELSTSFASRANY